MDNESAIAAYAEQQRQAQEARDCNGLMPELHRCGTQYSEDDGLSFAFDVAWSLSAAILLCAVIGCAVYAAAVFFHLPI